MQFLIEANDRESSLPLNAQLMIVNRLTEMGFYTNPEILWNGIKYIRVSGNCKDIFFGSSSTMEYQLTEIKIRFSDFLDIFEKAKCQVS